MRIKGYVIGSILGPSLTILILLLLFFLNPEAGFKLFLVLGFFGGLVPPYVLMYGSFAILFQIRRLPSLILLTNVIPLVIFGFNCFNNGCGSRGLMDMSLSFTVLSFWATAIWLFVRDKKQTAVGHN